MIEKGGGDKYVESCILLLCQYYMMLITVDITLPPRQLHPNSPKTVLDHGVVLSPLFFIMAYAYVKLSYYY